AARFQRLRELVGLRERASHLPERGRRPVARVHAAAALRQPPRALLADLIPRRPLIHRHLIQPRRDRVSLLAGRRRPALNRAITHPVALRHALLVRARQPLPECPAPRLVALARPAEPALCHLTTSPLAQGEAGTGDTTAGTTLPPLPLNSSLPPPPARP